MLLLEKRGEQQTNSTVPFDPSLPAGYGADKTAVQDAAFLAAIEANKAHCAGAGAAAGGAAAVAAAAVAPLTSVSACLPVMRLISKVQKCID